MSRFVNVLFASNLTREFIPQGNSGLLGRISHGGVSRGASKM